MERSKTFSIKKRIESMSYALKGLVQLINQEHNAWIHLAATIAVIIAGFVYHISPVKWMAICIAIGLVWIAEAFNTAMEMFCDLVTEGKWHPVVKKIKDISAAAVLIAAAVSIAVACSVFLF